MFVMLMYVVNDACGLFVSFLSICVVMAIHMYIVLVGLDWDYEWSLMMCLWSEVQVFYYWLLPFMMLFVVFTCMLYWSKSYMWLMKYVGSYVKYVCHEMLWFYVYMFWVNESCMNVHLGDLKMML